MDTRDNRLNKLRTIRDDAYAVSQDALDELGRNLSDASVKDLVAVLAASLKTATSIDALVQKMEDSIEENTTKTSEGGRISPMAAKLVSSRTSSPF